MKRRYRKRPVEIEALRFEVGWTDEYDIKQFAKGALGDFIYGPGPGGLIGSLTIRTLEGDMKVNDGDFVIRGVRGEFYPCKPDIFEATYEEVV